jgi:LPS export ABC transporter protein LptC
MAWKRFLPVVLAVLVGACEQQSTTPSTDAAEFELPADNVFHGFNGTLMTAEGIRQAVVASDSAYSYEESGRFDLFGVELEFYAETGALTGTLTSDTGDYDFGAKMFTARGNVVLVTPGPKGERRLETDEMFYDIAGDRLWSDHSFTLNEGGSVTRGQSFRSNSGFTIWEVRGATGTLPNEGGSGTF